MSIEGFDDELWVSIQQEEQRQEDHRRKSRRG